MRLRGAQGLEKVLVDKVVVREKEDSVLRTEEVWKEEVNHFPMMDKWPAGWKKVNEKGGMIYMIGE